MGRAERRLLERQSLKSKKREQDLNILIAKAQANQKKLTDSTIDDLEQVVTDANVACVFTAMAYELIKKFGISKEEVVEILNKIDDDIGVIGSDDCPTIREFKIKYALMHGMNICLSDDEAAEVERRYAKAESEGQVVERL